MAGLRSYVNPPISGFPSAVRNGQGLTLLEAGFLDVTKAPYNADATGVADSRAAFQAAIDFGYLNCLAVWVPKGTYRFSGPIELYQIHQFGGFSQGSNRKHAPQLIGDTFGGNWPTLRPSNGALGSSIFINCRYVETPGGIEGPNGPARLYNVVLRGFNIDMGDNPNATAVSMAGAQWCTAEDLNIFGSFNIGFLNLPGSGGSVTNLTVTGGNIGIFQNQFRPSPTVHGVRLINQATVGMRISSVRCCVGLAGFEISGAPIGIQITTRGTGNPINNLTLVDGAIQCTGTAITCLESAVYARNVYVNSGTGTIMVNGQAQAPTETISGSGWQLIQELAFAGNGDGNNTSTWLDGTIEAPDAFTLDMGAASAPDTDALIAIHTWDADTFPTWFNAQMLDVRDFGAVADDLGTDNSGAITAALQASAAQGVPAFLPRGFWSVRGPVECPVGAQLFGSSFTNCVIKSHKTAWVPTAPTAIFRTADAVGQVRLVDFCVDGHEGSASQGITHHKFITVFHGRSSNMLMRCLHINRQEYFAGGNGHYQEPVAVFSGNAGGRVYNLALDLFHGTAASMHASHRMILIDGTSNPLTIYQPDSEGTRNEPQCEIKNSSNVVWHGFKWEDEGDELLQINDSDEIFVIGGSGNYIPVDTGMFRVRDTPNIVLAVLGRQGSEGGLMLRHQITPSAETTIFGSFKLVTAYRNGAPTLPTMPAFPFASVIIPPLPPPSPGLGADSVGGVTALSVGTWNSTTVPSLVAGG